MSGAMQHFLTGASCLCSLLNESSPDIDGNLIPSTLELLQEEFPGKCSRDFLPPTTKTYIDPGGHRQWPRGIKAMLDRFSMPLCLARQKALERLKAEIEGASRLEAW